MAKETCIAAGRNRLVQRLANLIKEWFKMKLEKRENTFRKF